MNTVQKAYNVLGLEPGTSFEPIKRRYKRLVMVWHPDRMQNDAGRREAEEELKRINGAYDILKNHFEKQHTAGASCACQPSATAGSHTRHQGGSSAGTSSGNGAGTSSGAADRQKKAQEQEARRRHEERNRKAEEESRRAAEESRKAEEQRRTADASKRAAEEALKQAQVLKGEQLRWKIAKAAGAAVILMLGFAFAGVAARNLISDIQRQWSNQSQQTSGTPISQAPPPATSGNPPSTDNPDNPYIPLEYRFPGGNPVSWRQFMNDQERKQRQREDEQRRQDIYFTRLAIDRNQKIIDHCTNTIAQLEAKIADPFVSEFDKQKLRDYRDFQQRNLEDAQRELSSAQQKLERLQTEHGSSSFFNNS